MPTRTFDLLARPWALVIAFVATMAVGYSFTFVQQAVGGPLLDVVYGAEGARARIAAMTPEQVSAHLRGTLLNDTLYPLSYGALFLGLIWRWAGPMRRWFVVPVLAVIVCDLAENGVQALALAGVDSVLWAKDLLTPAKFALFVTSLLLVVVSAVSAAVRAWKARGGN